MGRRLTPLLRLGAPMPLVLELLRRGRPSGETLVDAGFLVGLAAIAVGCGWIYPPLLPIVGGAMLAYVCWVAQRAAGANDENPPTRVIERIVIGHDDDEDDA